MTYLPRIVDAELAGLLEAAGAVLVEGPQGHRKDGDRRAGGSQRRAARRRRREKDGLEVDAVVEAADGRWAAFEIKLGERWVDDGAKSLRRLAKRLEGSDHGKPSALAVIVPTGYGHVRPGEVGVVPIGALGP